MRNSWLIAGLIISVAFNVFLLGAGAGVIALGHAMARENALTKPGALMVATAKLDPTARRDVREMLRQERQEVLPDATRSRDLRVEAWSSIADPQADAAAIKAKLASSRQIDIGVRSKVEERLVDYMLAQPANDRAIFAAGMRHVLAAPPGQPPAAANAAGNKAGNTAPSKP